MRMKGIHLNVLRISVGLLIVFPSDCAHRDPAPSCVCLYCLVFVNNGRCHAGGKAAVQGSQLGAVNG